MALNAEEVLAKAKGDIYLAAHGEGAPSDTDIETQAALEALGWEHQGWVSEEGPSFPGFEGDTVSLFGWNLPEAIITSTVSREAAVELSLLQYNAENLQLYFPGSTYNAPGRYLDLPSSGTPTPRAFLMTVSDGVKWLGIYLPKVSPGPAGPLTFPDGQEELSEIPLRFTILADAANSRRFVGLDLAAEEGS